MKDTPDQTALRAYLNMEHRRLPSILGHSARARWLDANFGGLETVQNGSKYVCALPEMYYLKPDTPLHIGLIMMHFMGASHADSNQKDFQRMRFTPLRLEMTADSLRESVGKLHKTVVRLGMYEELRRYQPKDGQDASMLVSGKSYAIVRQDDPLHDHKSPDLIDFSAPIVTPWVQRVRMLEYNDYHSHLLNPKCE